MHVLNSFAVTTAVSVISLFIMLAQPVGAGTISISSPAVTISTVSGLSDCQDAIRDRECDSRLPGTDDSVVAPSAVFDSIRMSQQTTYTAGSSMTLSDLLFVATPALGQTGAWIDSTVSTPVGGPTAPIMTQGLVLSTGNLLDFAWTLSSKSKSAKDSTGGEKSAASTASVRHPTIVAAPEPDQLAYAAGAGAMFGIWHLRRFRRARSSRGGLTAAAA